MTSNEFTHLFNLRDPFPIQQSLVTKYITTPKKLSIIKMIEQNALIPDVDYSITNDIYTFSINAFKQCAINHKSKCLKEFFNAENNYNINKIGSLENEIKMLTDSNDNLEVTIEELTDELTREKNNIHLTECTDVETNTELLYDTKRVDAIYSQLQEMKLQITILSSRLDKILNNDILAKLDSHAKKINTINIL